jgi:hypothetical protein
MNGNHALMIGSACTNRWDCFGFSCVTPHIGRHDPGGLGKVIVEKGLVWMSGSLALLPGEKVNLESSRVLLQVTNYRVRHRFYVNSAPQVESILLDSVASTGLRVISKPGLLVIAGVLVLVALLATGLPADIGNGVAGVLVFFAVLLVLVYFLGRSKSIAIESTGGYLMLVPAVNLTLDECYFLLNAIDRAKLEFLRGELQP